MNALLEKNIEDMKVKEMQQILKNIGSYYSLKNKAEYVKRLKYLQKNINFSLEKRTKRSY